LWISTANGLSRFDQASGQFRNYFEADGLQSNEFIYNAALRLRSGEFAFGGIKGFNLFDPGAIKEVGRMPRLMLTGITVNGTPVEKDASVVSRWGADQVQEIRVPYRKAFFSFDFTALEYSAPKEISYAYRMDGWDARWTEAGGQRKAIYTHLDEGSYIFRVRSTNAEGKWNPAEIALHIVVLPPWYRTWWAWTLYVLAAASLIALWLVYRDRQTKLRYQFAMARADAEKEKAENERKLSFFTNISHEFRTPLTLIINPVKDLLKRSADHTELHVIHRNARRMLSLVDQIMLFRKTDSGADTILPVKLDLYQLCREVYFSFTQQARSRNIRYEFDCDSQATEIYADREKSEIILFNLVSNALKYTPDNGSVFLHIREYPDRLAVEVADSGPGIPAGVGDRIFERFYQVTGNGAPPKPGFGIGLFLARQFALAHKGDLSYNSEPGKGAVFTLTLLKGVAHYHGTVLHEDDSKPSEIFQELIDEGAAEPAPTQTVASPDAETLRTWVEEKKTMLIVDDDTAMRQYIAGMFRETFATCEAQDGDEALRIVREHAPDIVISDIRMQGMNGIDLCVALRKDPATVHIPVILLTGTLAPELQLQGVEGGADDYLTKPFDKELLRARVANLLQSRNNVRRSIFNEITHGQDSPARKISSIDKAFLDRCTAVIENHLDEEEFNIQALAMEMGISHSSLYKKIKSLSGHSLNALIRLVRLRNAAILCINTDYNVNEIAIRVGIFDRTHFREQFQKVYGMTAAEYIRKYRKPLASEYPLRQMPGGKGPAGGSGLPGREPAE
ncbi:MAG TPA: response regulator, partial [Puia sp.]|nr:response regulator [Puia sp.]